MSDIVQFPEQPVPAAGAEVEVVEAESPLDQLRAANAERVERMAAMGALISPESFQMLRLDILIDLLLPEGGAFRHLFESMFEANVAQQLDRIAEDHNRRKLLEGVRPQ